MNKTLVYYLIICILFFMNSGCLFKGSDPAKNEKLYYEPPERLIDDYTALIEEEEVDWAWAELGFTFSNYESITVNPVLLLTQGPDQKMADKIYQGLTLWFDDADIELSDTGELLCEVAITDLKLERSLFSKVNLFDESIDHYWLQIELIITDKKTQSPICKIRHGAVAPKKNVLLHRVMVGLISYFDSHS